MTELDHLKVVETRARELVKSEIAIGQLKTEQKSGVTVHPDKFAFANERRGIAFHALAKALDELSDERRWEP